MKTHPPPLAAACALGLANLRYWPSIAPAVRRELRRWEVRANGIENEALRQHALAKLREERFNAEVAATLATLAPRHLRRHVVIAIVAFQVLYDYLDAITEQPVADPLRSGRRLYRALGAALGGPEPVVRDDGGYLGALGEACAAAFAALPAATVVGPVARASAARCGEAQTRAHAVACEGVGQLARWSARQAPDSPLTWWEVAAGSAAAVLAVHALIAAAADVRTTRAEAWRIDAAYLPICALTTLLDSFVDAREDAACGAHRFLAYYRDEAEAAERLRLIARDALAGTGALRHAPHHAMSVAGATAYYLSALGRRRRGPARGLASELGPLMGPTLLLFRAWRLAKRHRRRRPERPSPPPPLAAQTSDAVP